MQGFKVIATLPNGTKSHFVPSSANNLAGAKAATDSVGAEYAGKGITPATLKANFFDDQRDYVPPPANHMAAIPAGQRCWCGWHKRGDCLTCPDELSFADNKKHT
jgi:hypothetical protein